MASSLLDFEPSCPQKNHKSPIVNPKFVLSLCIINVNFFSYEKILLFNYRNSNSNADVNRCKFAAGCKRKL